jgi:hypothetical protein
VLTRRYVTASFGSVGGRGFMPQDRSAVET